MTEPSTVRFGVRSMVAPLRRVLLRSPATTGDFAAADWRIPGRQTTSGQRSPRGTLIVTRARP